MSKITIVTFDGTEHELEAKEGWSVMELARQSSIPGIEAECGGCCACATCHVYVDEAWLSALDDPIEMEGDMLEFAFEARENSRLSCQIRMSDRLDGLVVRLPERQT